MSHRKRAAARWVRVALAAGLAGAVLAPGASAAQAAAPTPESATFCDGGLTRAKATVDDPNPLKYKFHCDWGVTAYTLLASRGANYSSALDDFSADASVFDGSGNPVSTESFSCAGSIPGNGINCNAGAGGVLAAPNYVEGTLDTTDPYCAHIPAGAKPSTKPEPAVVVQLVVTDTTGAEDGPFRLWFQGRCRGSHAPKPRPKQKSKRPAAGTRATRPT